MKALGEAGNREEYREYGTHFCPDNVIESLMVQWLSIRVAASQVCDTQPNITKCIKRSLVYLQALLRSSGCSCV